MKRTSKLSSRILVSQVIILIVTVAIGFVLYRRESADQLDQQYQQRALSVAEAVAALPQVRTALAGTGDPGGTVRTLAEQIRRATGASYVVVIDRTGTRLSHPLSALVGQKISEPVVALDGRTHLVRDPGSLGLSEDGIAPVFAPDGSTPVGEVSAGIEVVQLDAALAREVGLIALWTAVALAVGALVAVLVARQLKKTTFGLELPEIARLLQEREAMLHGIREGVVALDPDERVSLINDEARRLLGLHSNALGQRLDELLPAGRLRAVLSGLTEGSDQVVLTDRRCLVANRMCVSLAGRALGSVVTLRDRTETEGLLRELTSTRGLTDALRAQQHEFANRMHTVAGLLELGRADEALRYLTETEGAADGFAESVSARISRPIVAALVVAKATVAAERAVTLLLSKDSLVRQPLPDEHAVVTILGNLIDNAIDAAATGAAPAHVTVRLRETEDELHIRVSDTGPGIPDSARAAIFQEGFTTKLDRGGHGRGLGLAIVRQVTRRIGGQVSVADGPGSAFTVTLPRTRVPEPVGGQ